MVKAEFTERFSKRISVKFAFVIGFFDEDCGLLRCHILGF